MPRQRCDMEPYLTDMARFSRLDEPTTRRLIKHAQAGDVGCRNAVVEANLALVVHYAKKHQRQVAIEDLVGEGNLGLLHAVDLFDLTMVSARTGRHVKFVTYATYWVRQALIKAVVAKGSIRVPQYVQEAHRVIKLGRTPMMDDDKVDRIVKPAANLMERGVMSLDNYAPVLDEEPSLHNVIGCTDRDVEDREELGRVMQSLEWRLDPRESQVIRWRYGIGCDKLTLVQIGEKLHITKERARQIQNASLDKLREALGVKPD